MAKDTVSTQTDQPFNPGAMHRHLADRYYAQLAQMSTGLFVGVLALMTFLLTVGLQRQKLDFNVALSTALVSLGAVLVLHVLANMAKMRGMALVLAVEEQSSSKDKNKEQLELLTKRKHNAFKWMKALRMLQQIVFVVSVIAVVTLAILAMGLFSAVATSATGSN